MMIKDSRLLNDKFEYTGKWNLPGNSEHIAYGTLKYDNGSISLKISGSLQDEPEPKSIIEYLQQLRSHRFDTILGITDEGIEITLEDCIWTHRSGGGTGSQSSQITTYHVNTMFVGVQYGGLKNIKFNNVTVKYTNFKEWINESGITTDQNLEEGKFTINSETPESHKGHLIDDFDYNIFHHVDNPGHHQDRFDATIKQDTLISITSKNKHEYSEFHKLHYRLQNFFMLCIGYSIRPLLITASMDDIKGKIILIYQSSVDVSGNHAPIRNDQMILTFKDLNEKEESVFQNWLTSYKDLEDAFDLYFENFTNSNLYPQDRFENVIQALEAFHRRRFDDELLERIRYDTMIKHILSKISEQDAIDWINSQRSLGNNLSLPQKLHQLFEQFPYLYKNVEKREEFVRDVRDTRNYFAHHTPELKKKAAESAPLAYLEQRLNVLMDACMLSELHYDEDELEKLVIKFAKRRQLVKIVGTPDPYEWLV
ncbi:MAG: HEPN domain-containing protein [Nitrosotalea sp.]